MHDKYLTFSLKWVGERFLFSESFLDLGAKLVVTDNRQYRLENKTLQTAQNHENEHLNIEYISRLVNQHHI